MNESSEPDPVAPLEQPVLDYGVAGGRSDRFRILLSVLAFLGSFVIHGMLAIPAIWIAAAGHGSVLLMAIFFPWAFLLGFEIGALIQCGAYGLVMAVGILRDGPGRAFRWLLIVHAIVVLLFVPVALSM